MKNAEITAIAVEISKALINRSSGFHSYDLYLTNKIGNATRLAANIRQKGIISRDELGGTSVLLRQDFSQTSDSYLRLLEDLGWVEINNDDKDNFIEEYIPPLDDVMNDMGGEVWENGNPEDIDIASIETLSLLKNKLITREGLNTELSVPLEATNNSFSYGKELNIFDTFTSQDGIKIAWSPLYWPNNTDNILKYLKTQEYPEFKEIEILTEYISSFQGIPIEKISSKELIGKGIACGYFPSAAINDSSNIKHEYVFKATPNLGINPKDDIFEKARQIVACIRHGQYHADYSKIIYPISILNALENNVLSPHPYAKTQYAPLILNGVCNLEKISDKYTTNYRIKFIDTYENKVAMQMAREMLEKNEDPVSSIYEPKVEEHFSDSFYNFTAEQRQIYNNKKVRAENEFERLLETTTGYKG